MTLTPTAQEELLARRRDRAIAIVLSVKERECDEFLSPEAQRKLRKAVLDQFNDFASFAMDLLGTQAVNEEYINRLDLILTAVTE